ncbi:MAG: hypothetical protein GDA39_00670 [Hyphomonadaceae bacterium]|nr:hypothetical protein [Hyphomonadaceae bacterium]MBC6411528.1 hypothetical protein [Hyphomonadaceae bacterium]
MRSFKQALYVGAAAVLSVASTLSVMAPSVAHAQATEGRQFGAKAGAIVNEALQFLNSNEFASAAAKLKEAISLSDLNPYERSTIYQMTGAAQYELDQYDSAISSFESAINAGGLLPNEADALRVNIAQLLIANGQYAEGARRLEDYLNGGGQEKPQYVELLTNAWVQSENYTRALPWAEKWFRQASPKERTHFDLLNFLYNNLGMSGKQADLVKVMIARWPNDKQLWDSWSSLLANDGREKDAFEVNKMLYLSGVMDQEQDLTRVVQYYSFYDMPFQAAQILEMEMNAGRIPQTPERLVQLSDLYRQAREYRTAIPILERAASQSGRAKLYADLGEALYNEGNCGAAEEAFKEAIDRGYNRGKSWMLIATCRYEDAQREKRQDCSGTRESRRNSVKNRKRDLAIEAFNQVPGGSRESRDAKRWVQFIRAERKALEDRCTFEANVVKEQCFIAIRQAYSNQVFTGGELEITESCQPFQAEFDRLYRQAVNRDAGG